MKMMLKVTSISLHSEHKMLIWLTSDVTSQMTMPDVVELSFVVAVSSGSVTVNADSSVQILAEEAHPLDRFDAEVK